MTRKTTIRADIRSTFYGSIITIEGISKRGRVWLREHVSDARNCCDAVNAEHRYGMDILEGALGAGLVLRDASTNRVVSR